MTDRKLEPRTCVLTWYAADSVDPLNLIEILERVHAYMCDSLPGSTITAMHYDHGKLEIVLRETS